MQLFCMFTCSCAIQCRFNVNCKFVQPPNPEVDAAAHVPNADAFWEWVDTAVATTKRMIEFDTTDRQARVMPSCQSRVLGLWHSVFGIAAWMCHEDPVCVNVYIDVVLHMQEECAMIMPSA